MLGVQDRRLLESHGSDSSSVVVVVRFKALGCGHVRQGLVTGSGTTERRV
jgi:hypothetical protein